MAASRYHPAVYQRKRLELLSKLNSALNPSFLTQLKNLHKSILKEYRKSIQSALKSDGYDFSAVIASTQEEAEKEFEKGAKEVLLGETGWSYEETRVALREDVVAIADLLRVEETKKMITLIEVRPLRSFPSSSLTESQRNIKKQVSETVELSLDKPDEKMWDKILIAFKSSLAAGEEVYLRKATGTLLSSSAPLTEQDSTAPPTRTRRRSRRCASALGSR